MVYKLCRTFCSFSVDPRTFSVNIFKRTELISIVNLLLSQGLWDASTSVLSTSQITRCICLGLELYFIFQFL